MSTDSEEQLNSYDAQKTYYTQIINENPDWELAGVFADEGISGTSMKKRKEFNRMIAACKRGSIDTILSKSLSRFARNTVDCLETVRMLKANGIAVIFEKENINTLTESSEFLITLFSGFSQAESESISKNVSQGIRAAMRSGNVAFPYGRLLGYRKGTDGNPEIVPEEAETIRWIYRRYLDGCSLGQIKDELEQGDIPTAKGVQKWTYQVVRNILTNEKYIGDALLQKTYTTDCISKRVRKNNGHLPKYYVENNHPAIIPKPVFQQVQEEMARRGSKRKVMQKHGKTEQGKYSAKYALTERLVCGECGSPYKRCTWARNGRKRIVWRCVSRLEFGTRYCHASPTIEEGKLHRAIVEAINEFAEVETTVKSDVLYFAEAAIGGNENYSEEIPAVRQRLIDITNQQSVLLEQVLDDMENADLNAQLKAIMDEKKAAQERIQALEQSTIRSANHAARMEDLRAWMDQLEVNTEYDDQQTRKAIERITVLDKDTARIKFNYTDTQITKKLI